MATAVDDTIRFEECGARFEIFGPANDGTRMVAITDAGGQLDGHEASSFEDACRYVDRWLDLHVPSDAPGRFRGLRFLVWAHEGRTVEECSIDTRGQFLECLDDGTAVTDLTAILAWRQGWGDLVLEIRDGDGRLLLDNRTAVREAFALWNRGHEEYELSVADARMEGIDEGSVPRPGP